MDGQNEFGELAMNLTPDKSEEKSRELQAVLDEVCRQANVCLANGTRAARLDLIGSAAYDIDIPRSDLDYVLRRDGF